MSQKAYHYQRLQTKDREGHPIHGIPTLDCDDSLETIDLRKREVWSWRLIALSVALMASVLFNVITTYKPFHLVNAPVSRSAFGSKHLLPIFEIFMAEKNDS